MDHLLSNAIVQNVQPCDLSARRVADEFRGLLEAGCRLRPDGRARSRPRSLLSRGYTPKHRVRLFDATYYLANLRYDMNFRFFVAYVQLGARGDLHPRIFYKDSSLVWRCATHYIRSETENWIGKGAVKQVRENGVEVGYSAEETTNLPFEVQDALDVASQRHGALRRDDRAVELVLRKAPEDRVRPYRDFTAPRQRAMSDPRNLVHRGRPVARFTRRGDPTSLRFAAGFEPDFDDGILDQARSRSRLYGGEIRKFRIASRNGEIQYLFVASPRQVWIVPPQTFTTEISSYGVRTVDVHADEDLFVPGYEYHFVDESEDPPSLYSQIPEGFAGEISTVDPSRADASPWIEQLPVIREFRRKLALPCSGAARTGGALRIQARSAEGN